MIALISYGLGNIQAFANIYNTLNIPVIVATRPEQLREADRFILPGVGSFDWAMSQLNASGLREPLEELVIQQGRPVLGVCVGMQMLGDRSDEGVVKGLGWIEGDVKRLEATGEARTWLPHMGWNDASPRGTSALFSDMDDPRFYFLHSYYFAPRHAEHVLSDTRYGVAFASSVRKANIYGTQFHPEKSHRWGVQLLKNFASV